MKCNDFDAHIDEMLSGILHPDANQHMRQCERCTSHFRARAAVQNGLRQLASAKLSGPSRRTDRAVMDSYRRLQQRRAGPSAPALAPAAQSVRLLTFPSRTAAPARSPRAWLSYSAAAAVVLAVLGSGVHLWNGVSTVNAPSVAGAPTASQQSASASTSSDVPHHSSLAANAPANSATRRLWQHPAQLSSQPNASQPNDSPSNDSPSEAAVLASSPALTAPELTATDVNHDSAPPAQANAIMHLASSGAGNMAGAASNMAQSASSTWPGYSNLMYCDPVVCSGPMQVVHIKVPVGQVKPNSGQSVGNGFVNAEVVVGPDGVARAIRVAN
jgi:hypothetical protein